MTQPTTLSTPRDLPTLSRHLGQLAGRWNERRKELLEGRRPKAYWLGLALFLGG